jgi:hypothetical protein
MIFGAATEYKESIVSLGGQDEHHLWTNTTVNHVLENGELVKKIGNVNYKLDGHALAVMDDVLHVFGGSSNRKQSNFVIYAEKENILTLVESSGQVPSSRREFGLVKHNDNIYIFGGKTIGKSPTYLNDFYMLDWKSKKWTQLENNMIGARSGLVLVSDTIYLYGGKLISGNKISYDSNLYKFENEWVVVKSQGTAPVARESHQMVYSKDFLYLYGGWTCQSKTDSNLYTFDCKTDHWKLVNSVDGPGRFGHSMAVLNETLVCIGGVDQEWKFTETIVVRLKKTKLGSILKPKQSKKKPTKQNIDDLMSDALTNSIELPNVDKLQELEKNSIKEEESTQSTPKKIPMGVPMMNPFGGFVPKKKE